MGVDGPLLGPVQRLELLLEKDAGCVVVRRRTVVFRKVSR